MSVLKLSFLLFFLSLTHAPAVRTPPLLANDPVQELIAALYEGHEVEFGDCVQMTGRETIPVRRTILVAADTCRCGDLNMHSETLVDYGGNPRGNELSFLFFIESQMFDIPNGPYCRNVRDLPAFGGDSLRYLYAKEPAPANCRDGSCVGEDNFLFIVGKSGAVMHFWSDAVGYSPLGDIDKDGNPDYIRLDRIVTSELERPRRYSIRIMEIYPSGGAYSMEDDESLEYHIILTKGQNLVGKEKVKILSHYWPVDLPEKYR